MGIDRTIGDRAFTKEDFLEGTNKTVLPVLRAVRDRVNQRLAPAYVTTSSMGELKLDWTLRRHYEVTLTEHVTSVAFTNSADFGADFFLRIVQGSGAYAVTGWPSSVHWVGGVTPTVSTTVGRSDVFKLFYDGTNYWTEVSQNYV